MITPFEQYLLNKGFKRYKTEVTSQKVITEIEDNIGSFLSSYGPMFYKFKKNGKYYFFWGLSEKDRGPVMFLGFNKMRIIDDKTNPHIYIGRTIEDGYRTLFFLWGKDKYDEIYDVATSSDKFFIIDYSDEDNIKIQIKAIS